MDMAYFMWIVCITFGIYPGLDPVTAKSEKDLLESLLEGYNAMARPVKDIRQTVNVTASLRLVSIDQLNEREQVLKSFAWFNMHWHDEYMSWNPEEWGGCDNIIIPGNMLWTPDIVVRNSMDKLRGDFLDEDRILRYIVRSNGEVDMWTAGSLSTSCPVDMTYFPFDDQLCTIVMDSWIYTLSQMNLQTEQTTIDMDLYVENGQWAIHNTKVIHHVDHYIQQGEDVYFPHIKYIIRMQRKPQYYMTNVVGTCIILSIMMALVFVIPPNAGEKVSLGVTLVLAFTVFQLVIADSMPITSDVIPVITMYIICTMVMGSISIFCAVLVLMLHHQSPHKPIPSWLQKLTKWLSRISICSGKKNKNIKMEADSSGGYLPTASPSSPCNITDSLLDKVSTDESVKPNPHLLEAMKKLADEVDKIKSDIREKDESTNTEWADVARVLDHTLLVLFVISILVTSITLLGIYPLTKPEEPALIGD